MKNDDAATTVISMPPPPITTTSSSKKGSSDFSISGKSRYKFWVLAAILLLAFWSMFTGSVTLKWSIGNLTSHSNDPNFLIHDDIDILEVEEREKVVRHMWDMYTQSANKRLPRFWQKAFEAAYEALSSDSPGVRDAAVSEIAKMSILSVNLDPVPVQSTKNGSQRMKSSKQVGKSKEV